MTFDVVFFCACIHRPMLHNKASVEDLIFKKKYKQGLFLAQSTNLENLAWTLGKLNRYLEAKDTYEEINRLSKDKELKAKACFFSGFLLYEKTHYSLALKAWHQCFLDIKDTNFYEDYLWHEAFIAILEENYVKAKTNLKKLNHDFKKSLEKEKYQYFLAYIHNKLKNKSKSLKIFQDLSKDNVSYYALLSKEAIFSKNNLSNPRPYDQFIDESCKKWGVLPSLLYAIMKCESSFLIDAKSKRGALGLMQMMPEVALSLAYNRKEHIFLEDDLKNPKKSIDFASSLLAILKKQFGHYHLVIAAYNAGGDKVQAWLSLFGHLPVELFIEHIPFKETRNYVKKVLVNESIYYALEKNDLRLLL